MTFAVSAPPDIWILKGPGHEMRERTAAARDTERRPAYPGGTNTHEEGEYIAQYDYSDTVYVVTSAYHVPRAYLTIMECLRRLAPTKRLHVWGVGTVTHEQAAREAAKLKDAQQKGHALRWEDI